MSSLLTQAKDFEQKSKEQQQRTGQILQDAFSEHVTSVKAELRESEQKIFYAIRDHAQGLEDVMRGARRRVLRPALTVWLTVVLTTGLLFATAWGAQWYQSGQIAANWRLLEAQKSALAEQEKALADVDARTWGLKYVTEKDGQRYLVLPKGWQADANLRTTTGGGTRNAVRIRRE